MRKALFTALTAFVSISGFSISLHAQAPAPTPTDREYAPPPLRIPDGSRPTRYELTLTMIPGEAKAPGEIMIDVELDRPHPVLWLNADDVTVSRASVSAAATEVTVLSGIQQFVGLAFKPALPAGRHRLTLVVHGDQRIVINGGWHDAGDLSQERGRPHGAEHRLAAGAAERGADVRALARHRRKL